MYGCGRVCISMYEYVCVWQGVYNSGRVDTFPVFPASLCMTPHCTAIPPYCRRRCHAHKYITQHRYVRHVLGVLSLPGRAVTVTVTVIHTRHTCATHKYGCMDVCEDFFCEVAMNVFVIDVPQQCARCAIVVIVLFPAPIDTGWRRRNTCGYFK